jgi:DMSO reductase anchor subunit
MDLSVTIGLAAGLAALAAFAGWRGARPPDPRRGPRLTPWRMIMLLAAAGFIFAAGHAVGLFRQGG